MSNQIERMMELSFDPSSKGEHCHKSDKPRGLRSAHHSRNFEASISARVDGLDERLIETSHTLEKILEIVSSSAVGRVRSYYCGARAKFVTAFSKHQTISCTFG